MATYNKSKSGKATSCVNRPDNAYSTNHTTGTTGHKGSGVSCSNPFQGYTYGGYSGTTLADGNDFINDYVNNCINSSQDCCIHYLGSGCGITNRYINKCIGSWENEALNCYNQMLCPLLTDFQANADCASATEQSMINDAISARQAGINAGMGKARSGLLGDASSTTNALSTGANAYSSSIQNQGSTQADYLMKMGQACALCNCANNMQKGGLLNAIGAAFTGAGAGASLGATIGGSGGNNKC